MALTYNPTNLTTSAGLAPTIPAAWYDKKLLHTVEGILIYNQFAQKRSMPAHQGDTVKYRKYTAWGANTTPLVEGQIPTPIEMGQTEVTANPKQYGDFTVVTDVLDLQALDPVINDAVGLLGQRAAETIDALNIKEFKESSNTVYASTADAVYKLTPAMKLTSLELRKAVRQLKRNKARPFMRNGRPYYYAIVTPDSTFDLQSDPKWEAVATYQQAEKIENGEIGKLYGVVIFEASNAVAWMAENLTAASRSLTVKTTLQSAGKTVEVDEAISEAEATALAGRKVLINGTLHTIASAANGVAGAATITTVADVATADGTDGNSIDPGEAGAEGAPVYGTPVFGQDFYGDIDIAGKGNAQIIIHPASSGGTSNPLDQYSTIAYKIMAYCVKILDQSAGVMIKHGQTA